MPIQSLSIFLWLSNTCWFSDFPISESKIKLKKDKIEDLNGSVAIFKPFGQLSA